MYMAHCSKSAFSKEKVGMLSPYKLKTGNFGRQRFVNDRKMKPAFLLQTFHVPFEFVKQGK